MSSFKPRIFLLSTCCLVACSSSKGEIPSAQSASSAAAIASWQQTSNATVTNPNAAATNPNSTMAASGIGAACSALTAQIVTPTACTSNNVAGQYGCVAGKLVCQICTPAQTRTTPCPSCGETRNDVCSVDGTQWQNGVCGLCPPPTDHCSMQDACTPGNIEYRVCDYCPNGNCEDNSKCFGAKWQCGTDCQWHSDGACAEQQAECSRDVTQPPILCGLCGTETPVCDGCFLHVSDSPCLNQGVCKAGAQSTTPCSSNSCAAGFTNTASCNNNCQWDTTNSCDGCNIGDSQTIQVDCGSVQSGTCGNAAQVQTCVQNTTSICSSSMQLQQNTWKTVSTDTGTCSTNCGGGGSSGGGGCTAVCTPGATQTQSCSSACGAGSQTITCSGNGCGWSAPSMCEPNDSSACIPGTVRNGQTCQTCPGAFNPPNEQETCQQDCHTWNVTAQCVPCN